MTSSNGNIFRVTGPLCGEFTGSGEFPTQRPVTRSFDVFFDLRLNKRLSKQWRGWWFETPSFPLWRHRNNIPPNLWYKLHLSWQWTCWSLICSWSIACRLCSNYIFILNVTPGFNGLDKTTARQDEEHLSFWTWCALYYRFTVVCTASIILEILFPIHSGKYTYGWSKLYIYNIYI